MTNTKTTKKLQTVRNNEYYNAQSQLDQLYEDSKEGKIFKNLTKLIFSEANIQLAYRNIKCNQGSKTPGTDGKTIKDIEKMNIMDIIKFVKKITENYKPKVVRRKEIPKPNGSVRPSGIPCIWDRLIQQCILQILEPIMEAKFSDNSHGFRPLRSTEHAIASCYSLVNTSKLHYVIEIDIKGFFDNVNHSKLIKQLWTLGIRDKKLISIIKEALKAKIQLPDGTIITPTKGIPQSGIVSPLLANVVLNEFDRWIESQWQTNPVCDNYFQNIREGRSNGKGTAYRGMRRTTKLKEMYIVRYADDIRIFCRNYQDAQKTLYAVKEWFFKRLKLEVSEEKTRIVNIEKSYSEFLGIKFKVDMKSQKKTIVSHISDKSKPIIKRKLKKQIKHIQHNKRNLAQEVFLLNSMIRGMHNYYRMATRVGKDFTDIAYELNRVMYNRLKNYGISQEGQIPKESSDFCKYGSSESTRYIDGLYILPINYVKSVPTKSKNSKANIYTEEGRKYVHDSLRIPNIEIMKEMQTKPIINASLMLNDNRISKFSAQLGKCEITGYYFESYEDINVHHIKPKSKGGTDKYNNLVLVKKDIHILIHATSKKIIEEYMKKCKLSNEQIGKLNQYRKKVGNSEIN